MNTLKPFLPYIAGLLTLGVLLFGGSTFIDVVHWQARGAANGATGTENLWIYQSPLRVLAGIKEVQGVVGAGLLAWLPVAIGWWRKQGADVVNVASGWGVDLKEIARFTTVDRLEMNRQVREAVNQLGITSPEEIAKTAKRLARAWEDEPFPPACEPPLSQQTFTDHAPGIYLAVDSELSPSKPAVIAVDDKEGSHQHYRALWWPVFEKHWERDGWRMVECLKARMDEDTKNGEAS